MVLEFHLNLVQILKPEMLEKINLDIFLSNFKIADTEIF